MMVPVQFVIRLFLAALLPLGVVLPALALGSTQSRPEPARIQSGFSLSMTAIAQNQPKADAIVTLREGGFSPATVSAKPGQLVRFINNDERDYSLVTNDENLSSFSSGIIKPRKSWDFRVPSGTAAGNYAYTCKFRPRAKGTLRITE